MSDQSPILALKCSNCGRENAAGRQFCQFCGHRIAARQKDEPASKGPSAPSAEVEQLRAALQIAQDQNRELREQVAAAQEELNKIKAASAKSEPSAADVPPFRTQLKSADDSAAPGELQSDAWEKKWQSAEEKSALFEKQTAAKALDAYKEAADLAQHYAQAGQPAAPTKLGGKKSAPQAADPSTIKHD
jgi:hypothetical protein